MSPKSLAQRQPTASVAEDIADGLELHLDPMAPPGDMLPSLARLLRKLRERARAESKQATSSPQKAG